MLLKTIKLVTKLFKKNTLSNVSLMQQTISSLLKKQGIDAKVQDDTLEFVYNNFPYRVVFNTEENYPCCAMLLGISDSSYMALNNTAKSVAINLFNQDCDDEVKVTAREKFVSFQTLFTFCDHRMLNELFVSRLNQMDSICKDFISKFVKGKLTPKEEKRSIGFNSSMYKS